MAEVLSEFLAHEAEPLQQLVGRGILPKHGRIVFGGAPKANKSFVALNFLRDLARGIPVFSARYKNAVPVMPVQHPFRVLYIEQEIGEGSLQERFRRLIAPEEAEGLEFYIKTRDTRMRLDTPEGREFIAAEVEAVKPHFTLFDPLAQFHLQDENSAQEMGAVIRATEHLIEDFGTAIGLVHHNARAVPDFPRRGGDKLRGSSAIYAAADTIIMIDRLSPEHTKEPVLKMSFELRHGEPIDPIYIRRMASGQCLFLGEDYVWGAAREVEPRGKYRGL